MFDDLSLLHGRSDSPYSINGHPSLYPRSYRAAIEGKKLGNALWKQDSVAPLSRIDSSSSVASEVGQLMPIKSITKNLHALANEAETKQYFGARVGSDPPASPALVRYVESCIIRPPMAEQLPAHYVDNALLGVMLKIVQETKTSTSEMLIASKYLHCDKMQAMRSAETWTEKPPRDFRKQMFAAVLSLAHAYHRDTDKEPTKYWAMMTGLKKDQIKGTKYKIIHEYLDDQLGVSPHELNAEKTKFEAWKVANVGLEHLKESNAGQEKNKYQWLIDALLSIPTVPFKVAMETHCWVEAEPLGWA
jgi:hypothetical protein